MIVDDDTLTESRITQLTRVLESARRNPLLELRDPALDDLLLALAELVRVRRERDEAVTRQATQERITVKAVRRATDAEAKLKAVLDWLSPADREHVRAALAGSGGRDEH